MEWRLEKWPVADLKEYAANPRKLTEKGLADLKTSIEKFGLAQPIAINADGTIIGGHGRLKVLHDLKVKKVDCYIPDRPLTVDEFKELNARLNKNIAGEWDNELLSAEFDIDDLREIGFTDFDLGISFSPNTQPGVQTGTVSPEDIVKAKGKLDGAMAGGQELNEVMCPECGKTFYVE